MNAVGVEEQIEFCAPPAWPSNDGNEDARQDDPSAGQFVDSGLSAVRELALALGLVDEDDPALWEPV